MQYDDVLRNGTVLDGTGRPPFVADVAISADRIAGIGDLGSIRAGRVVDISGLVVAPGFIDVHSHDDAALVASPEMAHKLTQGVTTVIAGNCGISGSPYATRGDPPDLLRLVFKLDQFVAATFSEYLQKVEAAMPALNAGFLTGHTTLRLEVMGQDLDRTATEPEIRQMKVLLEHCLEAGALGLSTGLFYSPARAASTHEVIELAMLLSAHQGVYATHMRDEADGVVESIKETLGSGT
jgi:N-acyl-D-aspartate/D-glutamate deacylase